MTVEAVEQRKKRDESGLLRIFHSQSIFIFYDNARFVLDVVEDL